MPYVLSLSSTNMKQPFHVFIYLLNT